MLIDSHCHFNSLSSDQRVQVLSSSGREYLFIDSSIDLETSKLSLSISKQYDSIFTSLGFHPFCVGEFRQQLITDYEKLIDENKKIVAVGEIGLDYKAKASLNEQEKIFKYFIELAIKKGLPVVIHNRLDSFKILDILDVFFSDYKKVIFHCFSYSEDFLDRVIKRDGFVSFSLNVLRQNKDIMTALKKCPYDNLLLETDSPYMKVKNFSSTPLDILRVYSFVASIKDTDINFLESKVFSNANLIFNF